MASIIEVSRRCVAAVFCLSAVFVASGILAPTQAEAQTYPYTTLTAAYTAAGFDPADELGARENPHTYISRASVSDRCDFNRDSLVDAMDEILCRLAGTNFLTALKLITVP